jgi:hypothetical protein
MKNQNLSQVGFFSKDRKGLSLILSLLMVLLLIFVAIGIFWFATRGVLEEGTEQLALGSKCLEIDVRATAVSCVAGVCDITYTRSSGGDEIAGVKLVVSDGTQSNITDIPGNMNPLDTTTEYDFATGLTTPTSVEVAVYFIGASGTQQLCAQTNVFTIA